MITKCPNRHCKGVLMPSDGYVDIGDEPQMRCSACGKTAEQAKEVEQRVDELTARMAEREKEIAKLTQENISQEIIPEEAGMREIVVAPDAESPMTKAKTDRRCPYCGVIWKTNGLNIHLYHCKRRLAPEPPVIEIGPDRSRPRLMAIPTPKPLLPSLPEFSDQWKAAVQVAWIQAAASIYVAAIEKGVLP